MYRVPASSCAAPARLGATADVNEASGSVSLLGRHEKFFFHQVRLATIGNDLCYQRHRMRLREKSRLIERVALKSRLRVMGRRRQSQEKSASKRG
jgi:hypothetical protein